MMKLAKVADVSWCSVNCGGGLSFEGGGETMGWGFSRFRGFGGFWFWGFGGLRISGGWSDVLEERDR